MTTSYIDGGAVYIEKEYANIIGSHFSMNNATGKGGAVYINGVRANIVNSTFDNSFAYSGGTIYLTSNYCNVTNSSISNSHSTTEGGAIYSSGSYSNVYYSNFTNNIAENNGGAIYWHGGTNSKHNVIVGCIFSENVAHGGGTQTTKGGGAIYWSEGGTYCVVRDSKFINNAAITQTKADGGALLLDNNKYITIDNCLFDGNYVTGKGDLWVQGGAIFFRSNNITINNSVFQNSWSQKEGGAIYICNDKVKDLTSINVLITNTKFINNTAKAEDSNPDRAYGGGAVLLKQNNQVMFDNVTFINNTANQGGALSMTAATAQYNYFYNCYFIGNEATKNGGTIWFNDNLNIKNVTISNGKAGNYGGGIYTTKVINYDNVTFINNSAKYGGALYWNKASTTIQNLVFINNTAKIHGGAVYILNSATVSLNNFTNNSAVRGGAIYVNANPVTISQNNFISNNASEYGGAIYVGLEDNADGTTMKYNNFTKNTAASGGAIYVPISTKHVIISYSSFDENVALSSGGAIYNGAEGDTNKDISYSNFTRNIAGANGGAVFLANNKQTVRNCNFEGNNASGNGGAIYVKEGVSSINIKNSKFIENHADNGGAIYNPGSSTYNLVIDYCDFIRNTAVYNGGAVLYYANNKIDVYRDYLNFDGRGRISDTRTDVYSADGETYFIKKSLFEGQDNEDYLLLIQAISDVDSPLITVYIRNPKYPTRSSIRVVINLTNQSGYVRQVIINPDNFPTHYNPNTGEIYANFRDLEVNETYNITVEFSDGNYMIKSNATQAQAHGEAMGDFQRLQMYINQAIENATGDVVEYSLNRTFTFDPKYDTGCMNITNLHNKTLIIYGNGWAIDADGYSRIFNITASNVIFVNVIFSDGNANGTKGDGVNMGGAIFWAGAYGKLINSTVYNSSAYIGGGIYYNVTASNCEIINSSFSTNNAVLKGGAIDCNASTMELVNTVFDNNYAYTGGALCREINATSGRGHDNSFINNTAEYAGAAIAWINASDIHIDKYYFYNNTAGYSGGAIYVGEGSINC